MLVLNPQMNILLLGSGGREHAFARAIASSKRCSKLYCAPGNAGTALHGTNVNISPLDFQALKDFVISHKVDMVVVGPEDPLVQGITDFFSAEPGISHIPSKEAARLEGSKAFSKEIMRDASVHTSEAKICDHPQIARNFIMSREYPLVVKADGLAAGKGVTVAMEMAEARAAGEDIFSGKFGGAECVIEEFLEGEEASFIAIVDGTTILPLATSQDHKRLKDGDQGPNTGGMGAYSPAPVVTPEVHARVMREVILPTIQGMAADGIPYTGFLYAGLMIDAKGGIKTLEFNCRMGDPETQPIMMRLKSDLVGLLDAAIDGRLDAVEAEWDPRVALGVVLAAANYPEDPRKGDVITGLPPAGEDYHVFHAGTALRDKDVVTSGGRVLCVTALGHNTRTAQKRAYDIVDLIRFDGQQCRRDIGYRAIAAGRK